MARVRFLHLGLDVDVAVGTSILEAARSAGAPEGSHCGGVCACSTCHVYVQAGGEIVSRMEAEERDMLDLAAKDRRETSRLGCQTRVVSEGTCEVAISEESFRTYLDDHPDDRERAMAMWRRRVAGD